MTFTMPLMATEAEQIALNFLKDEWSLSVDEQEWLTVLTSRLIGESWYVVEIGVEGLPDKWIFQVYDTGACDPSYTFYSPIKSGVDVGDLDEFPTRLVEVLLMERAQA